MIIAIDGYEANQVNRVGIGQYAYNILCSVYGCVGSQSKPEHVFRVYLPNSPLHDMPRETDWWQYKVVQPAKLWTFLGLPLALIRDTPKADVIFSPTHYAPRFVSIPRVISIMDLSFLFFPRLFRSKDLHQLTRGSRYSIQTAQKVLTISEFTRRAILKAYHVPETKVVVTYPGMSMKTNGERPACTAVVERYHISNHYILSVGTLQPRKNFARLIKAFSLFLKENKQKFGSIDLVIVGKRGWLYEDILAAPKAYGVADRVKFLHYIPDAELSVLYDHALAFALPSLYEGFGLPVLEAMAHKCPVVVSDVSSLPEIAGRAGIYVDPASPSSICKGLLTSVRERNLMQGKRRIAEGLAQTKKFTWEKAAAQTLRVLEEVGGMKNG